MENKDDSGKQLFLYSLNSLTFILTCLCQLIERYEFDSGSFFKLDISILRKSNLT